MRFAIDVSVPRDGEVMFSFTFLSQAIIPKFAYVSFVLCRSCGTQKTLAPKVSRPLTHQWVWERVGWGGGGEGKRFWRNPSRDKLVVSTPVSGLEVSFQ